jgi:pimeloyl-ACP methyl ester carboxylesterase
LTAERRLALLGEWWAAGELARLMASPVYYGVGLPRGTGRTVLLLPGLFGNDLYLEPVHRWLRRLGHHPVRSRLAVNAGCPERLSRQVESELAREELAGPVALVGHSRGGLLAWAIAARLGARTSHLVLIASPVAPMRAPPGAGGPTTAAAPGVVDASLRARRLLDPDCTFPDCGCPFIEDLRRSLHPAARVVSFSTRDDAVVVPAACRVEGAQNIELRGTHSGLVYNTDLLRELAALIAAP